MPKFKLSALGDWILIAASVGVVGGIALLIIDLVYTQQRTEQDYPDHVINAAEGSRQRTENAAEVTKQRQSELRYFVEQNCPACHGMRATGSIGPALSTANLQHLSVSAVTFTILYGRPAKGMPPWETQLSEKEAEWIAAHLKGSVRRR